jgi:YcaO-like protein with predicted kinase domain
MRVHSNDDIGYKNYRRGTHRTVNPADTLARVRPLMPIMGITRIANVTGLDYIGIPVVMVCRPNARSNAVSQGKGIDVVSAKASGLMEAVETYHAETITLPLKLGTYEELAYTHRLIDVATLPRTLDSPFHSETLILWIEGRDLLSGKSVWLPYETVHTNFTIPQPSGSGYFTATTNGLASGNHTLEAIAHGICELVERDATALWKLRGDAALQMTGLDPNTIDDEACRQILEQFERADIEVRIWDTTSDVEIASFLCLIVGRQEDGVSPEYGAGCHPMRSIALLRALMEAAQARATYIAGTRDDIPPDQYTPSAQAERQHACRLMMGMHVPMRRFQNVPDWEAETFAEDIAEMIRHLEGVGVRQIVVVDLTKPMFQLPVVRVVIPGLEGPCADTHVDCALGARALAILKETP